MGFSETTTTILMIEDNSADADMIKRILRKSDPNVKIDMAKDGEEALEFIKAWENGTPVPLVILLDLKLPKVDGLEVLTALKTHEKFKVLPVVVLTSSNELRDIRRAYEIGANSYILKAIDFDQFSQAVTMIYRYWCALNIYPE
jgi:CheY-like chemotaxis protein